ncbi:hypothetical protein GCM10023185_27700 [Hymenobacter saemangeumensis]|uniref:Uncharacterized protein n=1 Tax=Hymenobacter saemangeumensis TaxID=1084522 RepID=A0ABP8IK06_9BACT
MVEHKVWTTFHKTATAPIASKYKTYSVEYDFGTPLLYQPKGPTLGGLNYSKTGGDLLLKITQKGLTTQAGNIERHAVLGGTTNEHFTASLSYQGQVGYELIDKRTNTPLVSFKKNEGTDNSPEFAYQADLELYLQEAFADEVAEKLLSMMRKRIDYTLLDHHWSARLGVNLVEGDLPAYQDISRAAVEFERLLSGPAIEKAKLLPLVAVWEAQLAKADWSNKKAEINRKVANALLGNLCAAYLLLEDYQRLDEKAQVYARENRGVYGVVFGTELPSITFEVEPGFSGPTAGTVELEKDNVAAYYSVVNFSGMLAGPSN